MVAQPIANPQIGAVQVAQPVVVVQPNQSSGNMQQVGDIFVLCVSLVCLNQFCQPPPPLSFHFSAVAAQTGCCTPYCNAMSMIVFAVGFSDTRCLLVIPVYLHKAYDMDINDLEFPKQDHFELFVS